MMEEGGQCFKNAGMEELTFTGNCAEEVAHSMWVEDPTACLSSMMLIKLVGFSV